MKILHAVHGFLPEYEGGTELYVLGLARALERSGHTSVIVAGSGVTARRDRVERETVEGFDVRRLRRSGNFHEAWGAAYAPAVEPLFDALLEEVKPDVVHVHHWKRLTSSLVDRARRANVPAVVTFHDLWSTCAREFRMRDGRFCDVRFLETDCENCVTRNPWQGDDEVRTRLAAYREDLAEEVRLAAKLLAPTHAHADRVATLLGIATDGIDVLPLGAIRELRSEEGAESASARFPGGPLRMAHWAHMSEIKGAHVVLEAMRHLFDGASEPPPVELHLFGGFVTDAYGARLRSLAEGLPVTFHGAFGPGDLERARFDIAVIPSTTAESYSYVVDEAFDLGVPILVSDLGALPERAGQAGASFAAGDGEALAERIREILAEPERLERWRGAIPPRRPSMDEHAAAVVAAYEAARSATPAEPRDEAARLRERLCETIDRLEDRRVSLLDLEGRAEYLTAESWRASSALVRAEARVRELASRLGSAADTKSEDVSLPTEPGTTERS